MKKFTGILLAACIMLGVVSCGEKKNDKVKDDAAPAVEESLKDVVEGGKIGDTNGDGKIIIGYISKNIVDPFHAPLNEYAKQKLDELKSNGTIDDWTGILDGETDGAKQVDRASEAITKKCDYVIILPAEAAASDPAVVQMAEAGIKVVVVNSATDSTSEKAMSYVGPNDVQAGKMMAEWVVKNVPNGGKYAHIQGVIGNSAQIQRGEGIEEIMKDNASFESVGDFPAEWQADKASNITQDVISKYGEDLVAIICDNDDMSSAAQLIANNLGRNDIVCVGVDGNPTPLEMIKNGELGATVLQDGPAQIQGAIDSILLCLEGKTPDAVTEIDFVLITKDNVEEFLK